MKLNYIIFLLGSFLIIFGSNFFLSKNEALNTKESAEEKSTSEFSVPEQGYEISEENVEEMQAVDRSKLLKFSNNLLEGEISLIGASINNVRLRNFFVNPGSTKTVELFGGSEFFSKLIFKAKDFEINTSLEFDKIIKNEKSEIILSKNLGDREIIVRYLIPPDSYSINREVIIKNKSSKNFIFRLFEESIGIVTAQEYYDFSYYYGDDVEKIDSTPSETKKEIENITWFGFSKKYFLGANIIDGSGEKNLKYEKKSTSLLRTVVSHKKINIILVQLYFWDPRIIKYFLNMVILRKLMI